MLQYGVDAHCRSTDIIIDIFADVVSMNNKTQNTIRNETNKKIIINNRNKISKVATVSLFGANIVACAMQ